MNTNVYMPINLSAQLTRSKPKTVIRRAPKTRNKKTKEYKKYDILQLDNQIRACFEEEYKKVDQYKKRLISMMSTLDETDIPYGVPEEIVNNIEDIISEHEDELKKDTVPVNFTYREYLTFYEQVKRLIQKIENISSGDLLRKYISLTQGIVSEYKKILSVPIKTNFLSKTKPKNNSVKRKKQLLSSFLKIANNFVHLEYSHTHFSDPEYVCDCGNSSDFEDNEGSRVCENCGIETSKISEQTSFKDIDRINLHQKYKYEKKSHFKENVHQYQGKQNKYIDPELYIKADEWLKMHGLLNKNENKKYNRVRKEHIRLFMSESEDSKITKHYEDLNLIYYKLTGTPCPDISHLEDTLYAQFDKLVEAFLSLDNVDRTNFLNGQFVIRKLLALNNHPFDPVDFPGLKTASRQTEHEEIWSLMIAVAGMNDPTTLKNANKF